MHDQLLRHCPDKPKVHKSPKAHTCYYAPSSALFGTGDSSRQKSSFWNSSLNKKQHTASRRSLQVTLATFSSSLVASARGRSYTQPPKYQVPNQAPNLFCTPKKPKVACKTSQKSAFCWNHGSRIDWLVACCCFLSFLWSEFCYIVFAFLGEEILTASRFIR